MGKLRYYRFLYRYLRLVAFQRDTLGRTAEALAASRPDATCCRFEEEAISFAAMNRRANRRANFFHGLGVGKGEVVCLLMENRPEFLETVIGLAKLGERGRFGRTAGCPYRDAHSRRMGPTSLA